MERVENYFGQQTHSVSVSSVHLSAVSSQETLVTSGLHKATNLKICINKYEAGETTRAQEHLSLGPSLSSLGGNDGDQYVSRLSFRVRREE